MALPTPCSNRMLRHQLPKGMPSGIMVAPAKRTVETETSTIPVMYTHTLP